MTGAQLTLAQCNRYLHTHQYQMWQVTLSCGAGKQGCESSSRAQQEAGWNPSLNCKRKTNQMTHGKDKFSPMKRTKNEKTNTYCFPANKTWIAGCITRDDYASFSLVSGKKIEEVISKRCLKSETNGPRQWQSKQERSGEATANIVWGSVYLAEYCIALNSHPPAFLTLFTH